MICQRRSQYGAIEVFGSKAILSCLMRMETSLIFRAGPRFPSAVADSVKISPSATAPTGLKDFSLRSKREPFLPQSSNTSAPLHPPPHTLILSTSPSVLPAQRETPRSRSPHSANPLRAPSLSTVLRRRVSTRKVKSLLLRCRERDSNPTEDRCLRDELTRRGEPRQSANRIVTEGRTRIRQGK